MKRLSVAILLVLFCASFANARLADGPDHTILWNQFTAITMIDSLAVGIAPGAIIVCRYDDSLLSFVPVNLLLVEFDPVSFKKAGTILMIKTSDNMIAFFDLSALPELTYLGTVDPGIAFADFALYGENLYLSCWFDGVWKFTLDNFGDADFVDSSMTGILMTQLEVDGDTLYALDEYNGILRYDLAGQGFGEFIDYLWIPFEATSFLKTESLVIITTATSGVLLGDFGHAGSGIVDSIVGIDNPLRTLVTDTLFVFLNNRFLDVVNRNNPDQRLSAPILDCRIDGDLFMFQGKPCLLLPRTEGGLLQYDVSDPNYPTPGLYRSGPINDLLLYQGKLFTGGVSNPIDVFSFDTSATPDFGYTMYNGLREVSAIDRNGDSLVILYSGLSKVAFITGSCDPDSFYIEGSIFINDTTITDIQYLNCKIDTVHPMLAVGETIIRAFAVTDSSGIYLADTWKFVGRISSVLVQDTLLFVSTEKDQLWICLISDSLDISLLSIIDFASRPQAMMIVDGRLVAFARNDMFVFDYSDPESPIRDTVITLPVPVLGAIRRDNKLYTVGPLGVGIYDLDGVIPELVECGGRPGSILDVEGNVLATTNGGAIHIYRLSEDAQPTPPPEPLPYSFVLSQNYPNPFNAGTSIDYSLPTPSRVSIVVYNILGQRVITLVDEEKPAGDYTAHWDGSNRSGDHVASGVYFYRLEAADFINSKKMILLK